MLAGSSRSVSNHCSRVECPKSSQHVSYGRVLEEKRAVFSTILQHRSASMMDQYIVRTGADLIRFLTFIASIFKGEKLYIF